MKDQFPGTAHEGDLRSALGMIGLCARAGQLISGEGGCELAVRGGQTRAVLLDEGASANLRKKFVVACAFRKTSLYILEEGRLGQAIGKPERMVAAVKPGIMAERLMALLDAVYHKPAVIDLNDPE